MKNYLFISYSRVVLYFLVAVQLAGSLAGCRKIEPVFLDDRSDASQYSSEVIDKWITLQLRLMRDATGIANVAFSRYYAYSGIVAFEALKPGIEKNALSLNWNGLTGMPQIDLHKKYYWPASVNAALALINRNIFINASVPDKAAIDSLEAALNVSFQNTNQEVLSRSNAFGAAVSVAVFNWSETDGYKHANDPYTRPVGPGLWVPTPPAGAPASTPYWGNNRTIIDGSGLNSSPGAPIAYSEEVTSPFFQMVKRVYDASQNLTDEQKNMAMFWRDIPGVSSPGHWLSILQQVLKLSSSHLDKAALSYALTGTCLSDACVSCWQTKYQYNLVRPISYIRNVMGFSAWNSFLTTPAHPEYSSAHAVLSAATADAFTFLFGNIGNFTDHTYDYLNFSPRTFPSFRAIGEDAGNSRLYAGIHYQPSIDAGLSQGRKVTENILSSIGGRKGD